MADEDSNIASAEAYKVTNDIVSYYQMQQSYTTHCSILMFTVLIAYCVIKSLRKRFFLVNMALCLIMFQVIIGCQLATNMIKFQVSNHTMFSTAVMILYGSIATLAALIIIFLTSSSILHLSFAKRCRVCECLHCVCSLNRPLPPLPSPPSPQHQPLLLSPPPHHDIQYYFPQQVSLPPYSDNESLPPCYEDAVEYETMIRLVTNPSAAAAMTTTPTTMPTSNNVLMDIPEFPPPGYEVEEMFASRRWPNGATSMCRGRNEIPPCTCQDGDVPNDGEE